MVHENENEETVHDAWEREWRNSAWCM